MPRRQARAAPAGAAAGLELGALPWWERSPGLEIVLGIRAILPLVWLIVPPDLVAVVRKVISCEEFVNVAWGSARVTTGPITVPLFLAVGLGLGGATGAVEDFGILCLASIGPIISVLLAGQWARFHWVREPTSAQLTQLTHTIARRVGRFLEGEGLLDLARCVLQLVSNVKLIRHRIPLEVAEKGGYSSCSRPGSARGNPVRVCRSALRNWRACY